MTLIGLACEPDLPAATDHFPQPGSLEALSAGTALDGFARRAAAAESGESALGKLGGSGRQIVGADAVAAARGG